MAKNLIITLNANHFILLTVVMIRPFPTSTHIGVKCGRVQRLGGATGPKTSNKNRPAFSSREP